MRIDEIDAGAVVEIGQQGSKFPLLLLPKLRPILLVIIVTVAVAGTSRYRKPGDKLRHYGRSIIILVDVITLVNYYQPLF
jgi:hypothetical protein